MRDKYLAILNEHLSVYTDAELLDFLKLTGSAYHSRLDREDSKTGRAVREIKRRFNIYLPARVVDQAVDEWNSHASPKIPVIKYIRDACPMDVKPALGIAEFLQSHFGLSDHPRSERQNG